MHSQDALSAYLASEFRHAIGSYRRSTEELPDCRDLPQDPLADSLRALTSQLQRYNTTLASPRYAIGPSRLLRHPQPPQPWTVSGPAQRAHR